MELIVTIAIMGIVTSIATLSFNTWQGKSKMESQVRELYADLVDARSKAFTQKKVHGIVFQPSSYVMKSYSSESEYSNSTKAAENGTEILSKTPALEQQKELNLFKHLTKDEPHNQVSNTTGS